MTRRRHVAGLGAGVGVYCGIGKQEERACSGDLGAHDVAWANLSGDIRAVVVDGAKVHEAPIAGSPRHAVGLIVLAPAFSLDQELHLSAHELLILFCLDAILQRNEPLEAILDDFLRHLVFHLRRGGARARGILEGKRRGEASAADQLHGVLKILFGLAREADDDIGSNRRVWNLLANLIEDAQELLRAVGTAHVLQDLIRAGLQRHMQLRAHRRGFRHGVDNIRGKFCRVRGGKPQTLEAVDLSHLAQQLRESEAIARHFWISEIHAIGVDVLAQQGDLRDALVHQRLYLGQDIARPAVLFLTAQGGNDAESAGVIAAYGHRHPTRVGGFALSGQNRGECL